MNNCGKFRAVRDISVAPMDASDQAAILKMMDEPEGVVNRRVRKKTVPPVVPTAKISTTSSTATVRKDPMVRFHNVKKSAGTPIEESGAERG